MTVVVTPNGGRYHRDGGLCGYDTDDDVRGLKEYPSAEDAELDGYIPCHICINDD